MANGTKAFLVVAFMALVAISGSQGQAHQKVANPTPLTQGHVD